VLNLIVEKDVPIPMRDGLKLAANIYRPEKPGKYPVIMAFTAFGKDEVWSPKHVGWGIAFDPWSPTLTGSTTFEFEDPNFWVPHGYVILIVDARGTGRSPGTMQKADIDGSNGEQGITQLGLWARDMYDAIEWAGTQEWSNGNVGLSGVSILAFSQWRVAALNPPHLKAIIPWNGMTDYHRCVMFRGGIPDTEFDKLIASHKPPHSPAWPPPVKETPPEPAEKEEDEFLSEITLPTLIFAQWTDHMVHTRGSFRAWRKISSKHKWLYTYGRSEWAGFYTFEAHTIRKMFFDHFLKHTDNRILNIPRVRLEVLETLDSWTVRWEDDFPIPTTRYKRLYLDATDNKLKWEKNNRESKATYNSANGKAIFDFAFEQDTEVIGYMNLKLWVSPEEASDMDLFIMLKKLDADGHDVWFDSHLIPGKFPVAFGFLRLSHRELDKSKSTLWDPYLKNVIGPGENVKPGEIVQCQIPILPSSTLFRKGEALRLIISGVFAAGEIEGVPFGFKASVNKGMHSIYTGGRYNSYLLVPFITPK
jgi:predicted acyl esterase